MCEPGTLSIEGERLMVAIDANPPAVCERLASVEYTPSVPARACLAGVDSDEPFECLRWTCAMPATSGACFPVADARWSAEQPVGTGYVRELVATCESIPAMLRSSFEP